MAIVTGTPGDDILRGTIADDILFSEGGSDRLFGKAGADLYNLDFQVGPVAPSPHYVISETRNGDASVDTIDGLPSLFRFNYVAQGYDFARFARSGAEGRTLLIDTISTPSAYGVADYYEGRVKIIGQFDPATPDARIEILRAGGVDYNLLSLASGTTGDDIIVGWIGDDTLNGGSGNDNMSGGGGNDDIYGSTGTDLLFGGWGNDNLYGGPDADFILGEGGKDMVWAGDGNDLAWGGAGKDVLRGGAGDDSLSGGAGDDRLFGGTGVDTLTGGSGNDRLLGGRDRDIYVVSNDTADTDTILDTGPAPYRFQGGYSDWDRDELQIDGFATLDEAFHNVGFGRSGNDLVITYTGAAMPAGSHGSVVVTDHFANVANELELVSFFPGTSFPGFHISQLNGDQFTYSVHSASDIGGEDIVLGTVGNDEIYGGLGPDILAGFGGSDVFAFHDEGDNSSGTDIILDFDPANDLLDFSDVAGFGYADITVAESAYGNAVVNSIYSNVELQGVAVSEISADSFIFA